MIRILPVLGAVFALAVTAAPASAASKVLHGTARARGEVDLEPSDARSRRR